MDPKPPADSPVHITKETFDACYHEIQDWLNIQAMQGHLMKHGLVTSEDMYHIGRAFSPREQLEYVYSNACRVRDGFHRLYLCIRESQDLHMGHKDAADVLEECARTHTTSTAASSTTAYTQSISTSHSTARSSPRFQSYQSPPSSILYHSHQTTSAVSMDAMYVELQGFSRHQRKSSFQQKHRGSYLYPDLSQERSLLGSMGAAGTSDEILEEGQGFPSQGHSSMLPQRYSPQGSQPPPLSPSLSSFRRSTDAYEQTLFTYTGKEYYLLWEEYGIRLHFPPHPSRVHIEGTVSVLSRGDDTYILPEGSELVSAVYGISASSQLPVPLTVQVQHCIPLLSDDEAAQLGMGFVKASTQQGPPYVFRELDGGDFRCGLFYGKIQLTHFSDIAIRIKWRLGRPIPFFASTYYTQNDSATLVVVQNLAAHITAVKDAYSSALNKSEFCVKIDRHSPAIGLDVPFTFPWKVIPLVTPPKIDMDIVLHYRPGKLIPQVTLIMEWVEPGQPAKGNIPVKLTGVHTPESFLLQCTPSKTSKAISSWRNWRKSPPDMQHITLIKYRVQNEEKEFRLLQKIQHKWYDIGTLLGVPVNTIDSRKTNEEKCQDVLRMWLERGSLQYLVEWDGLIKVLEDVEMRVVARELREALDKNTHGF